MKKKFTKAYLKLQRVFAKRHGMIVLAIVLVVSSLVILRITALSNIEPDQELLDEQTGRVQSVIFNQDAIEKIEDLRDSNVKEPGTQIQKDRQNPFSE